MKRITAAVFIFLLLLTAAASVNRALDKATESLCSDFDSFKHGIESHSGAGIKKSFESLKAEFEQKTKVYCLFIQRSHLANAEKDFIELERAVENNKSDEIASLCESIKDELKAAYREESLYVENIF